MAQIYKLFSTKDEPSKSFSLAEANRLVPLIRRYTEEAIRETEKIAAHLEFYEKGSCQFKALSTNYDDVILRWAERIHRLGGLAKGLWTVDFDSGENYFCWSYPEKRIEHFHTYDETFKARKSLKKFPAQPTPTVH